MRDITFAIFSALLLGSIGFLSGYLGPILFMPDANQGPLFGIFTGPVSILFGALIGVACAVLRLTRRMRVTILIFAGLATAIVVLCFSMSGPAYRGTIIDAEIRNIQAASTFVEKRVKFWQDPKSPERCDHQRIGWEEDVQKMLNSKDFVASVYVYRSRQIFEKRKPWNRGEKYATSWRAEEQERKYYLLQSMHFRVGSRGLFFPEDEYSTVCPPDVLSAFLGLRVLTPVPDEFRTFRAP